jgi:hypothetical protein
VLVLCFNAFEIFCGWRQAAVPGGRAIQVKFDEPIIEEGLRHPISFHVRASVPCSDPQALVLRVHSRISLYIRVTLFVIELSHDGCAADFSDSILVDSFPCLRFDRKYMVGLPMCCVIVF